MQMKELRRYAAATAFALVLVASFVGVSAEEKSSARECSFEVRIYQVLTSVTGAGLTSHTLPGMNGWLQIIHQKLDDVELVMDGATLTWNGQPAPDNPRIIGIAILTLEGEPASVVIGSDRPLQYMTRKQDSLFELKTTDTIVVGLSLSVNPTGFSGDKLLNCDLSFRYSWVKDREKIEGVNLEVGQPIIGRVSAEGAVQMRLGEWSCYQTPVESEGLIFLFLRAQEKGREAVQEGAKEPGQGKGGKDAAQTHNVGAAETTPEAAGPKVEVGGAIEVRGGYRSGGRK
jgi:hypothetical protein